jgi:hypothetical protein
LDNQDYTLYLINLKKMGSIGLVKTAEDAKGNDYFD